MPTTSFEARVAQFSEAAHRLEFVLHGWHGPISLTQQLSICGGAQRGIEVLRRISPLHLSAAFDDADRALQKLRVALEQSGQAPDG